MSQKLIRRSHFRKESPILARRRVAYAPQIQRASVAGIRIYGKISDDRISRTITPGQHISGDLMDRWADIQAGILPRDDRVSPPPTVEEIDTAEAEALLEVDEWGIAKEGMIKDHVAAQLAPINEQLEELSLTWGPDRAAARRRSRRLKMEAQDLKETAEREIAQIADAVREGREHVQEKLRTEVAKAEETASNRITELQAGLNSEVQATANSDYFHSDIFFLEGFDLIWEANNK